MNLIPIFSPYNINLMDSARTLTFLLYWVCLLTGCILIFEEQFVAGAIARALLMPILGAFLFVSLKPTHSTLLKIYFWVAILFLWLSDILRIFINKDSQYKLINDTPLLLSLATAGIANVFYILAYYKIRKLIFSKAVLPSFIFTLGCVLIYFMFFDFINHESIILFKTALICSIESFILVVAVASNILDSNSKKRLGIKYFLPASALALLSALLFVFNRYKLFTPRFEVVILLAYGYAQLLNIHGFRKTSR